MATIAKAITSFLTSLVVLIAAFGFKTDWATQGLIETISIILGAFANGFMTWLVPNRTT